MDRLSACYFCGAATVGDQGRMRVAGEASATVTLCGDCTDKLDRLASAAGVALSVGEADTRQSATETGAAGSTPRANDEADEERAPDPDAGGEPAPDPPTADPAPVADVEDDERAGADDDTPGIPDDAEIFTDDEDPLAGEEDPLADSREPASESVDRPDASADDVPGDATDGETDDRPLIPSERDDAGTDRSFKTSQAAGGRRETSHDPRRRATGESASPSDTAQSGPAATTDEPADAADTDAADDTDGDGGTRDDGDGKETTPPDVNVATVPRETYNKVVRLLQNRTFPVERDTVVSVATSAYGLSRRNCDATIDALVEHGVLEESEDGERLFRT